jgi:hypothetical protein
MNDQPITAATLEAKFAGLLAAELANIVAQTPDFRARVDAIFKIMETYDVGTARTALVIALASQPPCAANTEQPA